MNNSLPLLPPAASDLAERVDLLFWYITFWTTIGTILVCAGLVVFCVKYRRANTTGSTPRILGSHRLELFWTVTPLLIFLTFYAWGAVIYDHAVRPPDDAQEIYIIGKQWMWKAQYPGGQRVIMGANAASVKDEERPDLGALVLPVNRPVKFTMISEDVIHSFGIPAFRIKVDVLPGRYTHQWHLPTKVGEYHLFCDQYCGTWHSLMVGKIRVVEQGEYEEWLAGRRTYQGAENPVDGSLAWDGQQLFRKLQCINCHTNRADSRAPNLEGIYGQPRPLKGGGTVIADDAYIVESILNPRAKVREGWEPIMPHYQGQVSPEDLNKVVAYIRSLRPGLTIPRNANDPAPDGAPRQPKIDDPSKGKP